jgi:hypothetical protein
MNVSELLLQPVARTVRAPRPAAAAHPTSDSDAVPETNAEATAGGVVSLTARLRAVQETFSQVASIT